MCVCVCVCVKLISLPPACSGGKEWQDCGTACPLTCDNYGTPVTCTEQCVSGCFCPQGMVDLNGVCVDPASCGGLTPLQLSSHLLLSFLPLLSLLSMSVICPAGKEYQECGSPCAVTCDNYGSDIVCLQACASGCFCPEGKVEYSETCIYPEQCPPDETCMSHNPCPSTFLLSLYFFPPHLLLLLSFDESFI